MDGVWQRRAGHWRPGAGSSPERLAVAIDGATPLEHGWVRGEGDTGESLGPALKTLREATKPTTALTRVTRSSFRGLEAIGASARGADAWVLIVPEVVSERALRPRLAMAVPWMLRAATRWGARAYLCGVPLCLVGPHTGRVLAEPGRAFGAACEGCAAREDCPGVAPGYLERFGDGELRARESATVGPLADTLLPDAGRAI